METNIFQAGNEYFGSSKSFGGYVIIKIIRENNDKLFSMKITYINGKVRYFHLEYKSQFIDKFIEFSENKKTFKYYWIKLISSIKNCNKKDFS